MVPANFLFRSRVFCPGFPGPSPPGLPDFFVVLLWRFEFENLLQQQPVFSYLFLYVSLMSDVLHTVVNSVQVHTMPTEQAASVQQFFFFRGVMTPTLSACEARPSVDRCWTSLSVVVVVIVIDAAASCTARPPMSRGNC